MFRDNASIGNSIASLKSVSVKNDTGNLISFDTEKENESRLLANINNGKFSDIPFQNQSNARNSGFNYRQGNFRNINDNINNIR